MLRRMRLVPVRVLRQVASSAGGGALLGSSTDVGPLTVHLLEKGDALRDACEVKDMGVRELKGIADPEHVYQVGTRASEFDTAACSLKDFCD